MQGLNFAKHEQAKSCSSWNNSFAWTPEAAEKVDSRRKADHTSGHTHGQRRAKHPTKHLPDPHTVPAIRAAGLGLRTPHLECLESCAFVLRAQTEISRLKLHILKGFRLGFFSSKKHSHFVVETFWQSKHATHTHTHHIFRRKSSFCGTPCLPISNF